MTGVMTAEMTIWDRQYECMPREQLRELQLQRLQQTLRRVYAQVPCYQNKFRDLGVEIGRASCRERV